MPRHQALRATLDWSYELLSEPERVVLPRLAIFAGGFSLEAARAIAADHQITELDVVDGVSNLVAKSLVAAEIGGAVCGYVIAFSTRREPMRSKSSPRAGERERLARRHAEYCRDLFERAETEWETWPTAEWLADSGAEDRQSARDARLGLFAGR